MNSFIFGGQTGLTYDQIQKQRDIANELLRANMYTPQNVGEGLSAIGRALAAKAIDKRTSRADEQNRQASEARRASAMGAIFGGGMGSVPYSPAPSSQPPVVFDPNSPQGVASDAMAELGKTVFTPGDRDSFVSAMMPHALRVSEMTGLDPRLVIAQSAQETGWGKSAPNNNFFGIKSHGKGGANLGTFEYVDGQRVNINDSFRTYDSMGQSAEDYARFLMENPRYKEMLSAGDLEGQLAALGRSGYATDPNYSASVGSIANSIQIPGMSSSQPPAPPMQPAPSMSMGNPAIVQEIATLLADPYTPPGEKAMLEQAMAMQLQNMDPMRQMEIERTRLELEAMRNPQAQTPEQLRERQALAAAGGLQPGTPEYQSYMLTGELPQGAARPLSAEERKFWGIPADDNRPYVMGDKGIPQPIGGGGVTVNNNMPASAEPLGTEGQILVPDPNAASGFRVEVAEGSKLDQDMESAATKSERVSDIAITASRNVTDAANRALEAARNRDFGSGGTSLVASLPVIGSMTDSGEVIRQTGVLGAQAITGNLQAMRDASPTGGALGAVTAPELKLLADKSGALDPDSPNYERDLADYTLTLLETIHGVDAGRQVFRETWKGEMPEALRSEAPNAEGGLQVGTVEDGWEYIGGDPAQPESWRKVQQ